jgi:hypothetical protein
MALFSLFHLGSSNPQTLPVHPPASMMTMSPFILNKTSTAPEMSGANGDKYFHSPFKIIPPYSRTA